MTTLGQSDVPGRLLTFQFQLELVLDRAFEGRLGPEGVHDYLERKAAMVEDQCRGILQNSLGDAEISRLMTEATNRFRDLVAVLRDTPTLITVPETDWPVRERKAYEALDAVARDIIVLVNELNPNTEYVERRESARRDREKELAERDEELLREYLADGARVPIAFSEWYECLKAAGLPVPDSIAEFSWPQIASLLGMRWLDEDADYVTWMKQLEDWRVKHQEWLDARIARQAGSSTRDETGQTAAGGAENSKRISAVPIPKNDKVLALCEELKKHIKATPREKWGSHNEFARLFITKNVDRELTPAEKRDHTNLLKQCRGKFRDLWDPKREWSN